MSQEESRFARPVRPNSQANADFVPVISAVGLTRVFGSGQMAVTAVKGISLEVRAGEFLAVTGRSGSGKTTFLNLLSGLDRPTTCLLYTSDAADE